MKLKKSESNVADIPAAPRTGGAVIADRLKLDVPVASGTPAGVGKTASLMAMICGLVSLAMISTVAALIYMNWELVKGV